MAGDLKALEVSDPSSDIEKSATTKETVNSSRSSKEIPTPTTTTKAEVEYGSTDDHVFSDPAVAEKWRQVYEKARYENRHRFDPEYKWTAEEEKRLVRKIDARIMVWAWLMFCALDMHRRNINRAISDNMLAEIGMNTNDYNYGQTIFLACFLAAELPSGLISKKLGADRWIPTIMVGWSVTAMSQAFIHNRSSFYAIKALLGLLMGGFIPDIVLWLTYFYKSRELPLRLAWFWTALSTVNIVGSLLAAGILQMRGINGWSGWRWLFLIEGLITTLIGIFSWGLMPPGPTQTKHWFRGKNGWFTDHEESILVNRLLRDDPSKGDMNNRQAVGPSLLFKAASDWEQWPLYIIGLTTYIPPGAPTNYLSYILRQIGFSVFEANLLAIPSQFLFAANLLAVTWISRRVNERSIVSSSSNVWIFPWVLALVLLPASASPWARYAVLTGLLSYPYCHAILVAWNAKNSNAVRTRAVSAALYNMFVQSGNIIAVNIYRDDDQPLYRRGNKILLAITVFNIVLFYLVKVFYIWRNRVRDRRWNAMSPEEQENYILTTKDEGMRRLDFRFAH
ncbi:MFS general substrate transporter [Annulohypoxylon truncatum]|uniref:MFS general substrate transporter n=1 Tax=Annulohypoxylon truncatum TaxID=327061 RepID=UPI0020077E2A|nr:MFS general substrate transporter [Annulohypoxylon truncatum]KAI1213067.1 MFS general substrate transporter [Annulohypoxylon truncatum]